MDQTRVLAYNTPRGNRELYGRYAQQELVWDVISSDETEDISEIRLSYRPQGNFHTARIEHFNIGETGPFESRQIIRQPHLMPGFIAASIAIVLVAVTGAIFRGLSATGTEDITDATTNTAIDAPTPLATTVSIPPETIARLDSADGEVTIGLDADLLTLQGPDRLWE